MKFKSFNPESIPQNARAGIPKIALNSKSGFDIRSKTDQTMIFNSTFLVKKIFDSMAYEKHTGYILIGAEPEIINKVKYWPLITSTLKND